jgi:hypothetical protein
MNEPIRFREGSVADRDAVLALRAAAFGSDDPEKRVPAFWEWEFRRGYAGPGLLFLAESGTQLAGHIAFVPQDYVTAAGPARVALAVDAMVHPRFHRQGVFSGLTRFAAHALRDRFELSLGLQIRKASLAGMLAGGWEVTGTIPVRLKPLSLRGIVRDLGLPIRGRAEGGSRGAHPNIRPLTPSELPRLEALARGAIRQPRTTAFAGWRYFGDGGPAYDVDGWFDGDALRAFVVHRPALLKGMHVRAFVDAGVQEDAHRCLRTLIGDVCARATGASLAAALISHDHAAAPILRRCGFLAGPHRFHVLVQIFDDRFRAAATGPWSLSWGDTDHL